MSGHGPVDDRNQLVEDMQYLNLSEMKAFCDRHGLSQHIYVERSDGRLKKTGDRDRKDIALGRILDFARDQKRTGPTVYSNAVVADGPLPTSLTARTRIHYGQYEKHNPAFVDKLTELTAGAFRTGMIARLVLRDFWTAGTAPTLRQFADEWLVASAAHTEPRPEGAYLRDRWKGEAGPGWKAERTRRAALALRHLAELVDAHDGRCRE